jgi:predicted MFS family arabinose efflux permease
LARRAIVAAIALLVAFIWSAARKGDEALIGPRLFKDKNVSAAATTQFLSNGVTLAGQMLIPIFLFRICGRSRAEMGWMLAPMGLGMIVTSLSMEALTTQLGHNADRPSEPAPIDRYGRPPG